MAVEIFDHVLGDLSPLVREGFRTVLLPSGSQVLGASVRDGEVAVSVLSNTSAPKFGVRFRVVGVGEDIEGEDLRHVAPLDRGNHLFIDMAPLKASGLGVSTGHPDD